MSRCSTRPRNCSAARRTSRRRHRRPTDCRGERRSSRRPRRRSPCTDSWPPPPTTSTVARAVPRVPPWRTGRRLGPRRPGVDLRSRHRRRGAGALGDGVADGDAKVPRAVHDGRRGHRPGRCPRRSRVVGRRSRSLRRGTLAEGTPHVNYRTPKPDHGPRPGRAGRDRSRDGTAELRPGGGHAAVVSAGRRGRAGGRPPDPGRGRARRGRRTRPTTGRGPGRPAARRSSYPPRPGRGHGRAGSVRRRQCCRRSASVLDSRVAS